ncbi:MAG: Coenzyme F420 hydrogenase/dehydrogenase, beta subunit C-terminal domain, partial [Methanophagales archaeon]|nr:Coenzyme F420 hydrogenase/dehydrogenase, beta subunit C-terminal domain [Methanophagales archaeon]
FKELNLAIFGQEPKDILLGNYLNCYTGHATDYDIRYNSASGGLVTQLLIFALEEGIINGTLVTRMKKDNPLEPEPFIARTKGEIIEASKSKYCPVPANIALKEILESKEGERFAVVGLPCHLHGLRKAEMVNRKLKDRIALHIGIFCGTTKNFLGTEFQLRRMGIKKEEVAKLDYRGEGWPGSMTVQLKNEQRKLSELYFKYYDSKFCSFMDWRCVVCTDRTAEVADVSFGDAWLPVIEDDKVGTSIIISRSRHGEYLLQQMMQREKVKLLLASAEKVIESQGGLSMEKRDVKALFTLSKLLHKNVPIYNQELLEPKFNAYFSAIQLYSRMFLANHRLWKLLDLYFALIKYGSYLKSKLKL